ILHFSYSTPVTIVSLIAAPVGETRFHRPHVRPRSSHTLSIHVTVDGGAAVRFRRVYGAAAAVLAGALAAGCAYDRSFGFPIEQGDVEAGRQAFIDHQCHQ